LDTTENTIWLTKKQFCEKSGIDQKHLSTYAERGKIIVGDNNKIDITNEVNAFFIEAKMYKNNEVSSTLSSIEKQKKALDVKKIAEEIEILKVKKDKLHGTVIPTDMVKDLFSRVVKLMIIEFDNEADNMLTKIAAKAGLSNKDQAYFRGIFKESINKASNSAIDEAKRGVSDIINTYSESRGRGERL